MRPIDGDTVDKVIYEEIPLAYFWGRSLTSANKNVAAIRERIAQIPTLDAAPVVRCKDCVYLGCVQCALANEYNQYRPGVDPDWFCAKGKRRKVCG